MKHVDVLRLDDQTRSELWQRVIEAVETYMSQVHQSRVTPEVDAEKLRAFLSRIDFSQPLNPLEAVNFVVEGLWNYQLHTAHPRYFGLFNPTPTSMGIAADALAAAFNPQLAAWAHNPFAVEVEQHLIRNFADRFGYDSTTADGTFTSGGAEANHTAMLTALVNTFPEFAPQGVRGLERQPLLYVSTESHHSFIKAARACGLGTDAVRRVPVDETMQMNVEVLNEQIVRDRAAGFAPFLIVGTAGTTSAGVVDPLARIADTAGREKLWFHVDAAYGGAAILVPELRAVLAGIERSDSLTFDTHKWLSVPMGGGIYLTRHRNILGETFRITPAYIPPTPQGLDVTDPYTHSMQWSRRFIGLKVFLSLAVAGWEGYAAALEHQVAMGNLLRRELEASDWQIMNQTKLPVVCFVDRQNNMEGKSGAFIEAVAREVVSSGEAWISVTRVKDDVPVLRACITSYRTTPEDVLTLVHAIDAARRKIYSRA